MLEDTNDDDESRIDTEENVVEDDTRENVCES